MTPSSTAGPDKFCRHDRAAYPVWLFQLIIFAAVYTAARSADCRATSPGSDSCLSDHSFVIFYRFKSRMSSFCAFLRDIFAALRSLCTCPIALLLYFTVSEAGCHPFAPFYATFLSPCAHCVPARSLFCYILPFQEPDVIPLRLFTRYFCRLALIVRTKPIYSGDHRFRRGLTLRTL